MPALQPAEWILIRQAYEAGTPARELGRKFSVNDKTIRERAGAEGWVKPQGSKGLERASQRTSTPEGVVAKAVLRRLGTPQPPRNPPQPPRTPEELFEGDLRGAFDEMLDLMADQVAISRERVRDLADSRAMGNLDRLQRLFDQYMAILEQAGSFPDPEDEAAVRRRGEALSLLTIGRGDSIVGSIGAMLKLAVEIQAASARILAGGSGAPASLHLHQHQVMAQGPLTLDESRMRAMASMSSDQLATIWQASRFLEGNTERPPIPRPPGDPGDDATFHPQG